MATSSSIDDEEPVMRELPQGTRGRVDWAEVVFYLVIVALVILTQVFVPGPAGS